MKSASSKKWPRTATVETEAQEPKLEAEGAPTVKKEDQEVPYGVGGRYVSIGGGKRVKA
jgi:hypothetical protein